MSHTGLPGHPPGPALVSVYLRVHTETLAGPRMASPTYVELHCHSGYSFLDGASHVDRLLERALELGYPALALTDHNGLYGSMEFARGAKQNGLMPITGAELTLRGCFSDPH